MFTHILAPVDGSSHATSALDHAVSLQKLTGAKLSVITVYRHHSMLESSISMVRPGEPDRMDDAMRDHAKGVADEAKSLAQAAGAADTRAFVKNGPVARAIVDFATENGVDLIVMGGRGVGSVEGFLLGSVSHKVTGLSDCPVMVV